MSATTASIRPRMQPSSSAHANTTLLLSNLDAVADDLKSGAVVVITDTDLRVRTLPIPPGPRSDSST